jgi:hypothetical protein
MKRAQIPVDLIIIVVVLVAFSIAGFIMYQFLGEFNTDFQSDLSYNNQSKAILQDTTTTYPSFIDGAFIFILVGLWIALLVSSYFIESHPIFFVFVLLLVIIVLIFGAMMANSYTELMGDSEMATIMDSFPMTLWVFNHLVVIIATIGVTSLLALFGKSLFGQGGGGGY